MILITVSLVLDGVFKLKAENVTEKLLNSDPTASHLGVSEYQNSISISPSHGKLT